MSTPLPRVSSATNSPNCAIGTAAAPKILRHPHAGAAACPPSIPARRRDARHRGGQQPDGPGAHYGDGSPARISTNSSMCMITASGSISDACV